MTETMMKILPFTIIMAAILIVPPVVIKLSKRANERAKEYERITLNVTYNLKNKKREEFIAALDEMGMADRSRLEDGCIMYEYFSSSEDENKLLLVEKWVNPAAQRAHMETAHFAELKAIESEYVLDTLVEKYHG